MAGWVPQEAEEEMDMNTQLYRETYIDIYTEYIFPIYHIYVIYIHIYPIYTLKGVALGLDPCVREGEKQDWAQGEAGMTLQNCPKLVSWGGGLLYPISIGHWVWAA